MAARSLKERDHGIPSKIAKSSCLGTSSASPSPIRTRDGIGRERLPSAGPTLAELNLRCAEKGEAPIQVVMKAGGQEQSIELPLFALNLLQNILAEMAAGNTVTLDSIHAELTTREAADFLNVSRPFLTNLLVTGQIPHRKVGSHRRVLLEDVTEYKRKIDEQRRRVLDELAAQAQELGMGY